MRGALRKTIKSSQRSSKNIQKLTNRKTHTIDFVLPMAPSSLDQVARHNITALSPERSWQRNSQHLKLQSEMGWSHHFNCKITSEEFWIFLQAFRFAWKRGRLIQLFTSPRWMINHRTTVADGDNTVFRWSSTPYRLSKECAQKGGSGIRNAVQLHCLTLSSSSCGFCRIQTSFLRRRRCKALAHSQTRFASWLNV